MDLWAGASPKHRELNPKFALKIINWDAIACLDQSAAIKIDCASTAAASLFPQFWPRRKNSVWTSSNGDAHRTLTAVTKHMNVILLDPPQT